MQNTFIRSPNPYLLIVHTAHRRQVRFEINLYNQSRIIHQEEAAVLGCASWIRQEFECWLHWQPSKYDVIKTGFDKKVRADALRMFGPEFAGVTQLEADALLDGLTS